MKFNIVTIFPEIISDYASETILGRAQKNKLIKVNAVNLRDFADDKRRTIDDTPYGGGAGMVMKPEPIYKALKRLGALKLGQKAKGKRQKLTILLSPRGKQFDQRMAEKFSKMKEITFVCGRYEGIDQRVTDYMVDEEISIGPYVLAGGELGALIIIEAVARLIPGVLGNPESLLEESFAIQEIKKSGQVVKWSGGQVEYAQYTKPDKFKKWKVPEVLLSGNHAEIEKWRKGSN
ncbi:MAG: tRNA (guanosine(37)-N1)-methyltransferase TrmD [Candidatus Magasanikbacteria bacterium RIFOXYC2_FULL_40_16]|uniref:tRNA (guanine-N(1)-)-methyltransferase n=3 Tax=Candidatus Magasanikiibacteriota TaxID=1752731 RepID=A0A1F6NH92_9BACT|nr:MAG: tRNA (guanosine(37)-N1)-methyltransferase TrmD [Candidatus Magasanikbacteria bacterium RIFOXYA2_FULL_40_20]OGH83212.1 MAG: tRNA (guanosine(37)-N1)-methyltransferase TrmD [Candidatus Magasanikbacteria bacterium RIFOXYB1_FULL_40_15]OGH85145.1 MAG: tRNA (guanosine(37)-N1)-methyltransferase TrmD [Candidatus Magasanikbacteria bacterium RIFOXYB2_FULL_40_13]OGH87364.1 MAG: tRNA (guanosine(37)-N1)-methyltransferase TrmD [Candidatus Magasanikbacteria bacterium RIFOXYA1_FULL_40_8]OGH89496.1 MAG: 